VPGKDFGKRGQRGAGCDAVVEFYRSGQDEINKACVRRRKLGYRQMTFTGTMITGSMIEDLIATVERAEQSAQAGEFVAVELIAINVAGAGSTRVEPALAEPMLNEPILGESVGAEAGLGEAAFVEPWLASVHETAEYDSKFLGVA
jgi:hypothetical protein